ncbi:MAG: GNAT family N-acetyltransferase [Thermoleophilia bacterium]
MDNPMAIRRLTHLEPETLGLLVDYGRAALGESALDEWMLPVIASCGLLYVGRQGEEIVGAAEILGILDDGDIYLEGFYIRPDLQGRGYGTELMLGVIDLVAREGFSRMLVTLAPENEAGMKLYDRTGFREVDYLPDHYGPGRHRLLLAVELGGSKHREQK